MQGAMSIRLKVPFTLTYEVKLRACQHLFINIFQYPQGQGVVKECGDDFSKLLVISDGDDALGKIVPIHDGLR